MKRYLYYPGCSLRGTGKAYEESLLAVFKALDIELEELEDWNCCGATAYMAIDEVSSFALAGRNLAIAEKEESRSPGAVQCLFSGSQQDPTLYQGIPQGRRNAGTWF